MNKLMLCGMAAMACMLNGVALADDDYYGMGPRHGSGMMMKGMGRHWMTGKVDSVDHKTGWTKVRTDDGVLTVHFPPESVKDLQEGETITVHLGFTKGDMKDGGMMMDKPKNDGKMMK